MADNLHDWLSLILRWIHLIAGISWIGSSFYFMWLDSHILPPETPKKGVEGELWMVHSGGFYQVEKRLIAPGEMPKTLHWFKWEATFTWISGFFLLGVVYYMTGGMYLVDPSVSAITPAAASVLGIGLMVVGWFVYDLIWEKLGKNGKFSATLPLGLSLALLVGAVYALTHILSGRAAYIHVGSLFGTIMVLNVWVRILPAQQQMINATKEGRTPDFNLGKHAKRRSVHNSYMTFPVLFIMLSNHYPGTWAHPQNGLVLLLLMIFGAGIRHAMIVKKRGGTWALAPAAASLVTLITMTGPAKDPATVEASHDHHTARITFAAAHAVISSRCIACHSSDPADRTFGPIPGGVSFESPEKIKAFAERIKFRAVTTRTMPLANKTGITEDERALLGHWIDQGASLE